MKLSNERVRAVLARISGPDVLHVGCVGEGGVKFLIHSTLCDRLPACQIWGIDVNSHGVAELRRRGFRAVVDDAEDMQLGRKFDTIFAGELIGHLANPGLFLDGCSRTLRQGGRLVISTPNPFSVEHVGLHVKNPDGLSTAGMPCGSALRRRCRSRGDQGSN